MAEILSKSRSDIEKLARKLQKGSIAIVPTDTVFGIIAPYNRTDSLKKIFRIKGRQKNKPFIVLISNYSQLRELTAKSGIAQIVRKSWPGKFTFLFKAKKNINYMMKKGNKIAVRFPDNNFLKNLIDITGSPIVAPSANLAGAEVILKFKEIVRQFKNKVDLIVKSKDLRSGRVSRIIDITKKPYKILR